MRLAEIAFGQAKATLSPKASKAFFEAGKDYLAQAKAIDPTPSLIQNSKSGNSHSRAALTWQVTSVAFVSPVARRCPVRERALDTSRARPLF